MRVLYLDHTGRVSGAERSLLELMGGAKEFAEVLLACPEGELWDRARAGGIRTLRIEPLRGSFGSSPRELLTAAAVLVRTGIRVRAIVRRHRVDVIHAISPRAGMIAALCGPGGPGRVVDVRDAMPQGLLGAVVRRLLRMTAHALVFNSSFTWARFGPAGPARAAVAYPPVDIERFLRLPRAVRPPDAWSPTLGVVGQITPWKGQDDAIRILHRVRRRIPDARLRIVGDVVFSGPGFGFDNDAFLRRLVELTDELDLREAVEFCGPREDLESVFACLDVLLVPSWEEPFGRVVAEGMAAGVPVVATSRGGPAELIEDGVSGYLVEPWALDPWADACVRLLADRHLRARLSNEGRRRIASVLDRRGSIDQTLRLYRRLTNGRSAQVDEVGSEARSRHGDRDGVTR
jgi:glycosyltransferase involved in cell wall biosynthesis